jgi:hypothetical protein
MISILSALVSVLSFRFRSRASLELLKSLRGIDVKIGRHESAQSLGVPRLISLMFDDLFQVHSLSISSFKRFQAFSFT